MGMRKTDRMRVDDALERLRHLVSLRKLTILVSPSVIASATSEVRSRETTGMPFGACHKMAYIIATAIERGLEEVNVDAILEGAEADQRPRRKKRKRTKEKR